MTTIIALQKPDRVVIAADNQVTSTRKYRHPKMAKITQRGQYLIAGSGEVAARYRPRDLGRRRSRDPRQPPPRPYWPCALQGCSRGGDGRGQ